MTEYELRDFLVTAIGEENLDKGKAWGQARIKFQDTWPAGIKREDFNKFYESVEEMVASPLLLAAHNLTKLELEIIDELQKMLKSIDPRDADHVRNLVEALTEFNKNQLDLETCCDTAIRILNEEGVELPDELKVKLDTCWPGVDEND